MIDVPYLWSVSKNFQDRLEEMAKAGVLTVREGHFLYPADEKGMHLTRFFSVTPLARNPKFVGWIAEDIVQWAGHEGIRADCLLAPAQAGVIELARAVATRLNLSLALWNSYPTGRFYEPTGEPAKDFAEGRIETGMRVIPFNGVTQQGRCVGQRLQDFAKSYGGEIVGLAVFAKGTTGLVADLEKRWGRKFYATVQVDVPVYPATQCPLEGKSSPKLIPWTEIS